MRRGARIVICTAVAAVLPAASALAAFPYPAPTGNPNDYTQYRLPSGTAPNDLTGKLEWMYAATPEPLDPPNPPNPVNADPTELNGVRGAHVVDPAAAAGATAWQTTTGRPDVTIATLDSGIRWDDVGAMVDLRKKTRLNKGELPVPLDDDTSEEAGVTCGGFDNSYDANGDGVFNVVDYACDSRVKADTSASGGVGPTNLLDPQDLLLAFSDGSDKDSNGFVDDLVGWDFLDDDNDPYDDVQYGHGTGEARDSTAEADNGGELATCPNCMVIHMRVGDSFIADENRFAQATIYAVDNDVLVVQEALGTLNHSRLGRQAVDYAYDHGVAVVASAADEAAQHHNWPSSNPHVILVNSVTKYDTFTDEVPPTFPNPFTEQPRSYLKFNGCTNFSSKITVAIPSVSCSSDATGRGSGMAGLIYSAALNARDLGRLEPHPSCRRLDGSRCAISANEVRQVMASGGIGGTAQSDDVDFLANEVSCAAKQPSCTDPNNQVLRTFFPQHSEPATVALLEPTQRYPAGGGHDQFYGWGRVNMNRAVKALQPTLSPPTAAKVPPEAEITSPDWFTQIDPTTPTVDVSGQVGARDRPYTCRVFVAPGSYPNNAEDPLGDFKAIASPVCNGGTLTAPFEGVLATVNIDELKARFPPDAGSFNGRESGASGVQTSSGRPNTEPYGFVFKVVVETPPGAMPADRLTGEDRRNLFLHRDQDLLPGFPKKLQSDGESSPLFVDLDGDNRNELVLASSDGIVHAYRPDGSELPGWPVRGDQPPLHTGGQAFESGAVTQDVGGAMLASAAAADVDRDGEPELFAADLEGKLYGWRADGTRFFEREAEPDFSGRPLAPFQNERRGERNRTQHGFLGSPVLADLDKNDGGKLEVIAASMDRHLYAWNDDETEVDGFPALVVDTTKITSIDPDSHQVTFDNEKAGGAISDRHILMQGAIIDTPAVGNVDGTDDSRPEIVIGTNEEYSSAVPHEGPMNAGSFNAASVSLLAATGQLSLGNSRLYAVKPEGDGSDSDIVADNIGPGWPFKVGKVFTELLPIVGEGITGSPVIAPVNCGGQDGPKIGTVPDAGMGYVLKPNGDSCYGQDGSGRDNTVQTDWSAALATDRPTFPAVGHPAFGNFAGGISLLQPVAGLRRALDLALNEYQVGGQDSVAAWNAADGQFRPNFPSPVNDLQFLTGPSVSDIEPGSAGEELVAGTAHLDLAAMRGDGTPANNRWPKLTSDWTVANPLIGSFGTLDTDPTAKKVVVGLTRSGSILAYGTQAGACTPGSWPRFHHDNANSGDYRRDAVSPGRPMDAAVAGGKLSFKAPGDDLLCGELAPAAPPPPAPKGRYEVVHSDNPITGQNFAAQEPVPGAPAPAAPGTAQSFDLPPQLKRYVAIRAVDEQGNVGRAAVVDTGAPPGGGGPGGPGGSGGTAGAGGPGGSGAPGEQGDGQQQQQDPPPRCVPRKLKGSSRGLGGIAIGQTRDGITRALGRPSLQNARAFQYCVDGGGTVRIVFSRKGRVAFIASTAPSHRHGKIHPGSSKRAFKRNFPRSRHRGKGRFLHRRRLLFGIRGRGVRYVGTVDRGLSKSRGLLGGYVRLAGL